MTTYYVDAAATGTGDGLTPTNAFVSVRSIPWSAGDRAWVRKSHKEDVGSGAFIGGASLDIATVNTPNLPHTFGPIGFSRGLVLAGWPDASGAFFEERPTAGISAGWDTDHSTTAPYSLYGVDVPTICTSGTAMRLGLNTIIANMCLQNSNSAQNLPWISQGITGGLKHRSILNNVIPLGNGPWVEWFDVNGVSCYVEKITLVASLAGVQGFMDRSVVNIKHLVVHSASILAGIVGNNGVVQDFGLIENQSNSVAYAFSNGGGNPDINGIAGRHVRRFAGIRPYSGFSPIQNSGLNSVWSVDDYFGDGPLLVEGSPIDPRITLLSSVECKYDGERAMMFTVSSKSGGASNYWTTLSYRPMIVEPFQVSSGVGIEIRVPIYVDSTAVYSPAAYFMSAHLLAAGTKPVMGTNSTVIPGSAAPWTGTKPIGGTAYEMVCVFTPTESGVINLEVYPGPWFQATSGAPLTSYALFGKPYAVP